MTTAAPAKMKRLVPYYGADTSVCDLIAKQIGKVEWAGIPFSGGCSVLPRIQNREGIANDKHRHIINLARVVSDPTLFPELEALVSRRLMHPDELAAAQTRCRDKECGESLFNVLSNPEVQLIADVDWAADYFVCCWMGRSEKAGTKNEFSGSLAVRWDAGGGSSSVRWNRGDTLKDWHLALRERWCFVCEDAFDFLDQCKDQEGHAIYSDAPWVEEGTKYKFAFTEGDHRRLAKKLSSFKQTRIVIRYGPHPLIRELYPEPQWTWIERKSRNGANNEVDEVLILNGEVYA